ncbi:MAG: FkbM family methyltransferase [Cyclobacteriaceae bacterium]|nr:FkbM family methyltransferase [Cyclobacteriaceae bacterium]
MVIHILNYLHRNGFRRILPLLSTIVYFLKGFGYVSSEYLPAFRAYAYRVMGVTYMSLGPGWAYSYDYLKQALVATYNHFYLPQPGDCVVDIGAGLGEETVIYSMLVGSTGKVHALEANPVTHGGLQYMCRKNNFTQTTPHHVAIYHSDGEVMIEDDEENYLTNTIQSATSTNAKTNVRAVTLDTFVTENNIAQIDFLKSNIEGAEQFLIQGMQKSVRIIRHVCISCHDFRHVYHNHGEFYMTKQKVKTFLEDQGFEILARTTGNRVVDDFMYARNKRFA